MALNETHPMETYAYTREVRRYVNDFGTRWTLTLIPATAQLRVDEMNALGQGEIVMFERESVGGVEAEALGLVANGRWRPEELSIAGRMVHEKATGHGLFLMLCMTAGQHAQWSVIVRYTGNHWSEYLCVDEEHARDWYWHLVEHGRRRFDYADYADYVTGEGAAWLDASNITRWWALVDLNTLRPQDDHLGVLGQIFGSTPRALRIFRKSHQWAISQGFLINAGPGALCTWDGLRAAWRARIDERFAAEG